MLRHYINEDSIMLFQPTRLVCFVALLLTFSSHLFAKPTAQIDFFNKVAAGDADKLLQTMDPALQAELDAPVLGAWMKAFNERLGSVTKIQLVGVSRQAAAEGMLVATNCKITCELGTAESELTHLNGKLIGFNVQSKQMANFFEGPTSVDLYEQLGASFIRDFLANQAETAHARCHPALQKVVSLEQLREMIDLVAPEVGEAKSIVLLESRMKITDEADKLFLDFDVQGEQEKITVEITIEFVGLKGHLLGFDFSRD